MSWRGSRGIGPDRIAPVAQAVKVRTGGALVAETLESLGAEAAFGVPGVHALAIWDGLRTSSVRTLGLRTELNAGFAADGYARTTGRPAVLLLSTGPGAPRRSLAAGPHTALGPRVPGDSRGRAHGRDVGRPARKARRDASRVHDRVRRGARRGGRAPERRRAPRRLGGRRCPALGCLG